MLKSALTRTIGALALAVAGFVATAATAPAARADWICDNCDCKCGRCHSIARGIYCCPCVKSNTGSQNSSRPHSKVKSFQQSPSRPKLKRRR